MKKIFIIGSSGLLGSSATVFFRNLGYDVVATNSSELDITDISKLEEYINNNQPDVIINCAAFTNVDACETEEGWIRAEALNAKAPVDLARICLEKNITCIHVSTDYVFGASDPVGYTESDNPDPINAYGKSKFQAEQGIVELCGGIEDSNFKNQDSKIFIIRISWLFGQGATNFVQKIITKANQEGELKIVQDEIGCPTYTEDIVKAMKFLLEEKMLPGIYHVASNNSCSRYDFAKYILEKIKSQKKITPIKLEDFDRKIIVPKFSILKNTKLPKQRNWQAMVDDFLADF